MTMPAPRRCSVETSAGWFDQPWTVEEVKRAKSAGALFVRGYHDFASIDAEEAAFGKRSRKREASIVDYIAGLPSEQRELLREQLTKETTHDGE